MKDDTLHHLLRDSQPVTIFIKALHNCKRLLRLQTISLTPYLFIISLAWPWQHQSIGQRSDNQGLNLLHTNKHVKRDLNHDDSNAL